MLTLWQLGRYHVNVSLLLFYILFFEYKVLPYLLIALNNNVKVPNSQKYTPIVLQLIYVYIRYLLSNILQFSAVLSQVHELPKTLKRYIKVGYNLDVM